MNISVVGMGRWGSCIAWYCSAVKQHKVKLYGKPGSPDFIRFKTERKNDYLVLPEAIELTDDLEYAVTSSDYIIVSIPAQRFRGFLKELKESRAACRRGALSEKTFLLCMKGIECDTGKRLTQVFYEEMGMNTRVAVWVGPGHIQAFTQGIPNCMVIDSASDALKRRLADNFKSDLIRFYYGSDLIGTEIGAAAKNVMGIAAGVLDGGGVSTLKGPLMSRGAREVARLIKALGGNELSAYGLAHLGDYETTLFSRHSHNRMYGEMLVKGQKFEKLAEGVMTAAAMKKLGEKVGVELPITEAVYDVCFSDKPKTGEEWKTLCMERISRLFSRDTKFEF